MIVMPGQFVTFDLFTSKIEKTYFQNKCHDFSYTYPTCIIFVACNSTLISAHLMGSMYPLIVYISWWKYPTKWNIVKNLVFFHIFYNFNKVYFCTGLSNLLHFLHVVWERCSSQTVKISFKSDEKKQIY